ncbi:hypothetical protein AbraIFM66951_000594 [Aspergillus brasiliensis]|uniref:Heterokaryon incompatibility domain-containing protein n=1 Tax=Aspergillus brasiliensis TaxID=319629 RepID=A0A9W6DQV8_9EURO|nr:hypothetical protein AbraCBS73388_010341 [Aspergillus brasiliensis]GKZ48522.1 hypothetical protein AbraIFM66951_000594 [Aspergillus brasiliensis]
MIVCTTLKIPYLWVDRLCIIQDEEESKSVQISAMGDIYSHSVVTICAVAGEDANHGLPGVSEKRDTVPWYSECQGVHLVKYHLTPRSLFERSKWNSRGWTFQETILSSRLLLFTDEGVFFECSSEEGIRVEKRKIRSNLREAHNVFLGGGLDQSYIMQLTAFTQRDLTFESDILRAFSGILRAYWGNEHYYGIPYSLFGARLLWQSMDGKYQRRTPNAGDMFPSWSWSSILGGISLPVSYEDEYSVPLARWAIPNLKYDHPSVIIIPEGSAIPEWGQSKWDYRDIAVLMAWKEGCFPAPLPEELKLTTTWDEYSKIVKSKWSMAEEMADFALGISTSEDPPEKKESVFTPEIVRFARQPGRLLVYAQCLPARVMLPSRPPNDLPDVYIGLTSGDANTIGWLVREATNCEMLWTRAKDPSVVFEIVAIHLKRESAQRYTLPYVSPAEGTGSEDDPFCWRDAEQNALIINGAPAVFLMRFMLVMTADGISTRVGLGVTHLKFWIKACPQFKTLVLA